MKLLFSALVLSLLVLSCNSDDAEVAPPQGIDELVLTGVSYGPESRQFIDIYRAESERPTPIYFDAHGNGGNTFMPDAIIEDLNAQGISVIAWESLTSVNSPEEVETGWSDAELMFQWVIDHAEQYNFDITNMIIGGSSRGSILSWKYGHRANPNIKGLYMYNALPTGAWAFPGWWQPTEEVTSASPPIYFVYRREPGAAVHPTDPDIHDPEYGRTIVQQYESLGIGDRTSLVHSIGATNNTDKYQFLVDFALSVIDF